MGLFRLLLWIAIIFAAIWLWRRYFSASRRRPAAPPDETTTPMVRCAHCGVHTPHEHALPHGERWYCSRPHLEQGPRTGGR